MRSICVKCRTPITYVVNGSRSLWVHDANNDQTRGHDANTYAARYRVNVRSHLSGRFYLSHFVSPWEAEAYYNRADSEAVLYRLRDGQWEKVAHHL